ncbi:hypothetical protein EL22_19960 [Halostagnicola sp. A56]|uniref:FaeA/PapI family transcriptional regulator n=1 Tax=Halostagnicola sp. A56 TaxID=1495067 RepID=UPI0004A0B664|nr:FaeA/PapI family transcriptional regulator [Halostagnicola sp. A56]KDE59579.1 hypothetical protein EL22_19960 [Halostagnicola sp. A56]
MSAPWRYRCPEGHTRIERLADERAHRCKSCQTVYAGPPIDAKDVDEFPVGREVLREAADIGSETILESITEIADDPARNWIQTREIATDVGADPRQVGQILSNLEAHGHVERLQDKAHPSWALEADGRASADPRAIGLLVLVVGLIATFVAGVIL